MREPIISFERIFTLRKVSKTPDARYRSGYRDRVVLAENTALLPDGVDDTVLHQNHIHVAKGAILTEAYVQFSAPIRTHIQSLTPEKD